MDPSCVRPNSARPHKGLHGQPLRMACWRSDGNAGEAREMLAEGPARTARATSSTPAYGCCATRSSAAPCDTPSRFGEAAGALRCVQRSIPRPPPRSSERRGDAALGLCTALRCVQRSTLRCRSASRALPQPSKGVDAACRQEQSAPPESGGQCGATRPGLYARLHVRSDPTADLTPAPNTSMRKSGSTPPACTLHPLKEVLTTGPRLEPPSVR